MLGMRGVRLGVTMPAIYDMQARAIFEAAIAVNRDARAPVVPEVMIPLVSAYREVELVKARIDAIAAAVQQEQGATLTYKLGVMVETPRAALRAGDLAASSAFLSFGTNDLTQMTYGLSRDDAGRFMRDYVNRGVFPEDPFHSLDLEGVGELMLIAARRGRAPQPGRGARPLRRARRRPLLGALLQDRRLRLRLLLAVPRADRAARGGAGDAAGDQRRRGRRTPRHEAAARRPRRRSPRAARRRWPAACRRSRARPERPGARSRSSTPPGRRRAASRSG